nr:SGNH/GDSL hydrolase family protein [Patulibacter medicamentivorans]
MRRSRALLGLLATFLTVGALAGCGADDPRALQVVSLGDSLAVGVQPSLLGSGTETRQGYPRQFARQLRDGGEDVQLHELGCGAATSASVLSGGRPCAPDRDAPYANQDPTTSQVAYAEGLLSRLGDRRRVVLVDIGGNDVGACFSGGRVLPGCFAKAGAALRKNLDELLQRLRDAAPKVPIGVLNLYDPLLGLWDDHPEARPVLQREHRTFLREINRTIADAAARHDATLVDLADGMDQNVPFRASDSTRPRAVEAVCRLTWMCVRAPRVPDIHLRADGYRAAADAALRALRAQLPVRSDPSPRR